MALAPKLREGGVAVGLDAALATAAGGMFVLRFLLEPQLAQGGESFLGQVDLVRLPARRRAPPRSARARPSEHDAAYPGLPPLDAGNAVPARQRSRLLRAGGERLVLGELVGERGLDRLLCAVCGRCAPSEHRGGARACRIGLAQLAAARTDRRLHRLAARSSGGADRLLEPCPGGRARGLRRVGRGARLCQACARRARPAALRAALPLADRERQRHDRDHERRRECRLPQPVRRAHLRLPGRPLHREHRLRLRSSGRQAGSASKRSPAFSQARARRSSAERPRATGPTAR